MLKRLTITYIIILFYKTFSFASEIDSIDLSLQHLNGNKKLEALHSYSSSLLSTNPSKAKLLAEELLKTTDKNQYKYKGLAHSDLGEAYYYLEHYTEALDSYLHAEPYFLLLKDSIKLAYNYSNTGLMYLYTADYNNSITYFEKSLEINKKLKDSLAIARNLQNIGLIFNHYKKYEMEENYYRKALNIYKKLNDHKSVADILSNLGLSFITQGRAKDGYQLYKEALKEYTSIKDSNRIATVYVNLGYYNLKQQQQYDTSFYYFSLAKEIFIKINGKMGLLHAYAGLGDLMAAQNKKQEAIDMYLKCEKTNSTVGFLETQEKNLFSLYKTFKDIGDLENAIRVLENYHEIKDSLDKKDQSKTILDLENKYLYQKDQNEINTLKTKNRLFGICFFILLLLLVIGGIFIFYYTRNKQLIEKQRLLQLEQNVLRTQMNPHFIFNSLSAIQSYILDNKMLDAIDFLSDFADLMRMVLQCSQNEYINLEQEKEIIDQYINLQNKRFGGMIKYNIIIDKNIELTNTMIPPMLALPFIENSFEHGELYKRKNGYITISFQKRFKKIIFCIEDNGIGISSNKNNSTKKHKSLAIKIAHERLEIINNNHISNKIALLVEDRSKHGKSGTKIEFTIPLFK